MKTTIIIFLTACSVSAADIRVVGTTRIDLAPVHQWEEDKTGERPLKHWKKITINDVSPGVPWLKCKITAEGSTKTVYLKNTPPPVIQYFNQVDDLTSRIASLNRQISTDNKRLTSADAAYAEYGSDYYQNRETFRANLQNSKETLKELNQQRSEIIAQKAVLTSDFAMFTGQFYNKVEVWDCGMKSP